MMLRRRFGCSKLRIVLEDNVTAWISSLFKLFPMMLDEELLGKVMLV